MSAGEDSIATRVGASICGSFVGSWFPDACRYSEAQAYAEAKAEAAAAAGVDAPDSGGGVLGFLGVGDTISTAGDAAEGVLAASAAPLEQGAAIARWTTIGIVALVTLVLVLVAVFLFFYLRGFR